MMSLLKCEYKKTRGRYILITAIVITVLELCWVLYGDYDADSIEKGWMAFLYQLPLSGIFKEKPSGFVLQRTAKASHAPVHRLLQRPEGFGGPGGAPPVGFL